MGGTEAKTNEGAKNKPLTLLILALVMNSSTEYNDYWKVSCLFLPLFLTTYQTCFMHSDERLIKNGKSM